MWVLKEWMAFSSFSHPPQAAIGPSGSDFLTSALLKDKHVPPVQYFWMLLNLVQHVCVPRAKLIVQGK